MIASGPHAARSGPALQQGGLTMTNEKNRV